jgi:aryl-alcohol dehydrogenase-like predicted oxidoreductase
MSEFGHGPETIKLGDLEVRRLGFGAMRLPGKDVWGEPEDPARARAVVRRAVELGVNFIDTAWFYGPHVANRLIAEALHPYPRDLVIATKLGGMRTPDKGWGPFARPEQIREGMDHDLRVLRRDVIDIVHLRFNAFSKVPFMESLGALIDLRDKGKLRHIALSNVNVGQLGEALARTSIVAVQNMYNVGGGGGEFAKMTHSEVENPEAVLDMCTREGIAYLPFFPLAVGNHDKVKPALAAIAKKHGASTAQIAIAWLLARSPVMLPIPGTSSPEHVEENWNARKIALDESERAAIAA